MEGVACSSHLKSDVEFSRKITNELIRFQGKENETTKKMGRRHEDSQYQFEKHNFLLLLTFVFTNLKTGLQKFDLYTARIYKLGDIHGSVIEKNRNCNKFYAYTNLLQPQCERAKYLLRTIMSLFFKNMFS